MLPLNAVLAGRVSDALRKCIRDVCHFVQLEGTLVSTPGLGYNNLFYARWWPKALADGTSHWLDSVYFGLSNYVSNPSLRVRAK